MGNRGSIIGFQKEKYDWAVKSVMYGRKKDTGFVKREDAEGVVNDTLAYWIANPSKFNPDWAYNKLLQKRIDFMRDRSRREVAEHTFKYEYGYDIVAQGVKDPAATFETENLADVLLQEIADVRPKWKRELFRNHFIDGLSITALSDGNNYARNQRSIHRFKSLMLAKHGGD